MASFDPAFEKMICNEGGYILHKVAGDRGGMTYAGIARNYHPYWPGWNYLDNNDEDNPKLTSLVRDFYKTNFWNRIKGEEIEKQAIAETLFDFAVNAGVKTGTKLCQIVIGTTPDGIIGPQSLAKINEFDEEIFVLRYSLAKIARYTEICNKNRSQSKFLLGWLNRTLRGVA